MRVTSDPSAGDANAKRQESTARFESALQANLERAASAARGLKKPGVLKGSAAFGEPKSFKAGKGFVGGGLTGDGQSPIGPGRKGAGTTGSGPTTKSPILMMLENRIRSETGTKLAEGGRPGADAARVGTAGDMAGGAGKAGALSKGDLSGQVSDAARSGLAGDKGTAASDVRSAFRLADNPAGARQVQVNNDGSARIIGNDGTRIGFTDVRTGANGAIIANGGTGTINGEVVNTQMGFTLSSAPTGGGEASFVLDLRVGSERMETTAIAIPLFALMGRAPKTPIERTDIICVLGLAKNPVGVQRLMLYLDGTGVLAGPGVEIYLSDGGYDDAGDWVAFVGAGSVDGAPVVLEHAPEGHVIVVHGGAQATRVEAVVDGILLDADVVSMLQP